MSKKIFVCIKQVPDTESRFKLENQGQSFDQTQFKWIVNPYDEYAIEEALKVKSLLPDHTIVALCLGPKNRTVEALRTALAMGVDEAISIDTPNENSINHNDVALALSQVIQNEGGLSCVLAGKVAIDDNASLVPQMLGEALNISHVTIATHIQWSHSEVLVTRELEGGEIEKIQVSLPAVFSCNKGLNTPRYPSLPGIMKAKKKVIKEINLNDLNLSLSSYEAPLFELPPERPQPKILTGDIDQQINELVTLLRNESKVI